ncbi:DUF2269 family protein [Shimia sediminis]|uniref:DUF2269 family protein n=1 Tax=Shimia sediminis TaxID=2497945 RepID=UPI000F8F0309|nr:DUF2269 domain-containing protein [Shimia sediminis]
MIEYWDILRFAHVIGACVLLGTGAGIAFFMVVAQRSQDPAVIAHVAGTVVIADGLFTATAAVFQPLTGWLLAREAGWPLLEGWVFWAIGLYIVVGVFWLPVVWIQIRLRDMARQSRDADTVLPDAYHQLYRIWFAFGFPAFAAVLGILWLMLTRPTL